MKIPERLYSLNPKELQDFPVNIVADYVALSQSLTPIVWTLQVPRDKVWVLQTLWFEAQAGSTQSVNSYGWGVLKDSLGTIINARFLRSSTANPNWITDSYQYGNLIIPPSWFLAVSVVFSAATNPNLLNLAYQILEIPRGKFSI